MGIMAMFLYAGAFNKVKWNKFGTKGSRGAWFRMRTLDPDMDNGNCGASAAAVVAAAGGGNRRKILIATLEYDIADLQIKIKIGGLGVMAQLMGTNLKHQDLIWVVPMVGDVQYPLDILKRGEPFEVEINGSSYGVEVFYHILENITYVR